MNKILKYSLIGLGVVGLGAAIIFITKKPKDKKEESGDENKTAEKEETKPSSETTATETSAPTTSTASSKPSVTSEAKKPETAKSETAVNTNKLKGFGVSVILSKVKSPLFLKGKTVITSKEATNLMGAKGNTLFTLKKGTVVGEYVKSYLTKSGNYLVNVKMNDGKLVMVNGANLKFA